MQCRAVGVRVQDVIWFLLAYRLEDIVFNPAGLRSLLAAVEAKRRLILVVAGRLPVASVVDLVTDAVRVEQEVLSIPAPAFSSTDRPVVRPPGVVRDGLAVDRARVSLLRTAGCAVCIAVGPRRAVPGADDLSLAILSPAVEAEERAVLQEDVALAGIAFDVPVTLASLR